MRTVFIGGCDRSGTTFLGSLLGGAAGVVVTPESQFKIDCLNAVLEGKLKSHAEITAYLDNHWRYRIWRVPADKMIEGKGQGDSLEVLAEAILARVKGYGLTHNRSPEVWVDHTPRNLQDIHLLGQLFPDAKYLHIVRDGRAVSASVLPLDWGPNTASQAARWWGSRLTPGLAAETAWPQRVKRVSYEKLILEPEVTLRELCAFLGLEFNPDMVSGKGFVVPGFTQRQHALVGGKPDRARVEAWRSSLTEREREIFEAEVGGVLYALGYPLDFKGKARLSSRFERISGKAREFVYTYAINKLKYRYRRFLALR